MGDYDDGKDVFWFVVKKEIKDIVVKVYCLGEDKLNINFFVFCLFFNLGFNIGFVIFDRLVLKVEVVDKLKEFRFKVDDVIRLKDVIKRGNDLEVNEVVKESFWFFICCIMGYVDIGKIKLLDCIRGINV